MKNGEVPLGASGGSDGPAVETPPASISTADCKPASHDQHWCATHHKPVWECKNYENDLLSPQREFKRPELSRGSARAPYQPEC